MTRTATVRAFVLETHRELLEAVLACADDVAASWDGPATVDRTAVVDPFERALDDAGVTEELPDVLVGSVDALGESPSAAPVAAPPYVTMTARGPVLRATLESDRLVLTIRAFDVERNPTRYVRNAATPAEALAVELKSR